MHKNYVPPCYYCNCRNCPYMNRQQPFVTPLTPTMGYLYPNQEATRHYQEYNSATFCNSDCVTWINGRQNNITRGRSSNNSSIASVSRRPDTMEVFWIAPNGSIQDAYWYEGFGPNWRTAEIVPANIANASLIGGITAVSRRADTMEIMWIARDGSVQGAYWYEGFGPTWRTFQMAPAGSASTNSTITSVSRKPDTMEVFWIAPNGSIQDAYWYEGFGPTWRVMEIVPANIANASIAGGITAVSRKADTMEIWWIDKDGAVQDAYWYEGFGPTWRVMEIVPANIANASLTGGITALSRVPERLEVWWIGKNGSVQAAYWKEGEVWATYELAGEDSASTTGSITSVSRISNSLEVWWIGKNGSVQGAFWYVETGDWGYYELPEGRASTSGGIASVSRMPNTMEVWWIGQNGSVQAAYWYEGFGPNWKRYELAPTGTASVV